VASEEVDCSISTAKPFILGDVTEAEGDISAATGAGMKSKVLESPISRVWLRAEKLRGQFGDRYKDAGVT
jgi:hypothetical protein